MTPDKSTTALLQPLVERLQDLLKATQSALDEQNRVTTRYREERAVCHLQLGWTELSLLPEKMTKVHKAMVAWEAAVLDREEAEGKPFENGPEPQ